MDELAAAVMAAGNVGQNGHRATSLSVNEVTEPQPKPSTNPNSHERSGRISSTARHGTHAGNSSSNWPTGS